MRRASSARSLLRPCLALTVAAAASACDRPLDPQGEALAVVADHAALTLDGAAGAALVLTHVDFARGVDAAAIERAAATIRTLFRGCLVAMPLGQPEPGLVVGFDERGCGLPATTLLFRGAIGVRFPKQGPATALAIDAYDLQLLGLGLDGGLRLESERDRRFAFRFDHLAARAGGHQATVDGQGRLEVNELRTQSTFDGEGTITADGTRFGLAASGLHRDFFGDCYADRGTVTVRVLSGPVAPLELTLRFDGGDLFGLDSDDSGEVHLDFRGHTYRRRLAPRLCRGF